MQHHSPHVMPPEQIPGKVLLKCRPSKTYPDRLTCAFYDYDEVVQKNPLNPDVIKDLFAGFGIRIGMPSAKQRGFKKLNLPRPLGKIRTRPQLLSIKGMPPYTCSIVPALLTTEHVVSGPAGHQINLEAADFIVDCASAKERSQKPHGIVWGRP